MTFQDSAKLILLSLFLLSCPTDENQPEEFSEREVIVWVCHHPGSIWHLSECNEQCTARNYEGEAYCHGLVAEQCASPSSVFIRRACGFYNR